MNNERKQRILTKLAAGSVKPILRRLEPSVTKLLRRPPRDPRAPIGPGAVLPSRPQGWGGLLEERYGADYLKKMVRKGEKPLTPQEFAKLKAYESGRTVAKTVSELKGTPHAIDIKRVVKGADPDGVVTQTFPQTLQGGRRAAISDLIDTGRQARIRTTMAKPYGG